MLKKIIASDAMHVGGSSGIMATLKGIGRLTGDSKYYDHVVGGDAAFDGASPGCIDISCGYDGVFAFFW